MFTRRQQFLLLCSNILGKKCKASMSMIFSLDSNGYDKSLYCVKKSLHAGMQHKDLSKMHSTRKLKIYLLDNTNKVLSNSQSFRKKEVSASHSKSHFFALLIAVMFFHVTSHQRLSKRS